MPQLWKGPCAFFELVLISDVWRWIILGTGLNRLIFLPLRPPVYPVSYYPDLTWIDPSILCQYEGAGQ